MLLELPDEAKKAGLPVLAKMRLDSARRFQDQLPMCWKVKVPEG